MVTLAEQIVALHDALDAGGVPHAFGGALALAYHTAEPRATVDVDINIWSAVNDASGVLRSLPDAVNWRDTDLTAIRRDGQVRLHWDRTPVDLFFPQHPLHAEAERSVEEVPFAAGRIRVLSATHLAVFKALFNREKDWVDIGELLRYGEVDVERVERWLAEIVGADDERLVAWGRRVVSARGRA
ncbi:MAG: hypothetical protein QOJ32_2488 [Frankiaceae bacterium]|nr:hypothetical protein [Frankiaceae bacterium]